MRGKKSGVISVGKEIEYAFLTNIPIFVFKNLTQSSQDLKNNGLLSRENQETTLKIVNSMTATKVRQLRKYSELLEISNIWWQSYQIQKLKSITRFRKNLTFDANKYFNEGKINVKGQISFIELSELAIMIVAEFSSRSISARRKFRFVFFPIPKIVLEESQDLSQDILKNEILPLISKEPEIISPKRPKARFIRNLTKTSDETRPPIILNYLKIRISLETSGIEGLNQIVIQGDDVIRGAETLEQRHEISLKFMNSGPWIAAGTDSFRVEVGKGFQILQLEEKDLKNIALILNLL